MQRTGTLVMLPNCLGFLYTKSQSLGCFTSKFTNDTLFLSLPGPAASDVYGKHIVIYILRGRDSFKVLATSAWRTSGVPLSIQTGLLSTGLMV